jgi:hypothetical protein
MSSSLARRDFLFDPEYGRGWNQKSWSVKAKDRMKRTGNLLSGHFLQINLNKRSC